MRLVANLALVLSLALSFVVPSFGHAHQARRHHVHRQDDLAPRDPGEINLYKRFDGARFTYYAVGLGSCGKVNVPTDFIVALNAAQYNSQYCFQMITITIGGKTAQAQICDKCPGCPFGGLDFSLGLFEYFADTSVGVLTGSWDFDSGGSSPPPPPPPPPPPSPSPSPSPPPPPPPPTSVDIPSTSLPPSPTTTSQPPATTTTSAPSTTSSSSSTTTAVSSSNSTLVSTQTTSVPLVATPGAVPQGAANSSVLFNVNLSMVSIGQFLGFCDGL